MKQQDVIYMSLHSFELSTNRFPGKWSLDWAIIELSIAEAISILNKKGYFTVLCCQGHIPRTDGEKLISRMRQCYVSFKEDIIIEFFPWGFAPKIMKIGIFTNTIISNISYQYVDSQGQTHRKSDEMIQQEINERNNSLLAWAISLPEYQMISDEERRISM